MDGVAQVVPSDRAPGVGTASYEDLIPDSSPGTTRDSETEIFRRWRGQLADESGRLYNDLRKQWAPRYAWVWTQVALAYAAIVFIVLSLVLVQPTLIVWWQSVVAGWLAAIGIGYTIAFMALWYHEAAHFQLHPDRASNDRLTNLFLGIPLIQDIRKYRPVHFGHHKHLGDCSDTEHGYFDPLDAAYILNSLTGIKVLRVLLLRVRVKPMPGDATVPEGGYFNWVSVAGLVLHLGIIIGGLYWHQYALAIAWAFGALIFYPFFGAIRQVLEHRSPDAEAGRDYSRDPHGEFTRVFSGGVIAGTFGGAGFNRHLIHHWDPGISCTRFAEVERFLEHSQLGDFYRSRKTTYLHALKMLLRQTAREKLVDG